MREGQPEAHHRVDPNNRTESSQDFPAAIAIIDHILRQNLFQSLDIALLAGQEKAVEKTQVRFSRRLVTVFAGSDGSPCAMAELATTGWTPADHSRDFLVIESEDVVQEKDGSFRGRERLQQDEES